MNNLIIETSNLCKCYGVNMVVSEAHLCENTLEDYFKKITGASCIIQI